MIIAAVVAALVVPAGAAVADPPTIGPSVGVASVEAPDRSAPAAVVGERSKPRRPRVRKVVRLTLRSPFGAPSTVTVRGPRTFTVALSAREGLGSFNRRLPVGRYRVTAIVQTGPSDEYGLGALYRPAISRTTFRLTKRTVGRTTIRVAMRRSSETFDLKATAPADDRAALSWTLPTGTRAIVRRQIDRFDFPPLSINDGVLVASSSSSRRTAVDVGLDGSMAYRYALFLQAGQGSWFRMAHTSVTTPRPVFRAETGSVEALTTDGRAAGAMDVSTDGRVAVTEGTRGGFPGIFVTASGITSRVSTAPDGTTPGNGAFGRPAISGDGRWVVYASDSTNLVAGPVQGWNVYLLDRESGTTSVIARQITGNARSSAWVASAVDISADGERVVFEASSFATDSVGDVYLYARTPGTTRRLTAGASDLVGSAWHPTISPNGRFVSYSQVVSTLGPGPGFDRFQVYRLDLDSSDPAVPISPAARGYFLDPLVADDGTVAYTSSSSDLVAGDTNGIDDVFVVVRGRTARVSSDKDVLGRRTQAAKLWSLSADGRLLTYGAEGAHLVDLDTAALTSAPSPLLSPDGTGLVYTRATTAGVDLFRLQRAG